MPFEPRGPLACERTGEVNRCTRPVRSSRRVAQRERRVPQSGGGRSAKCRVEAVIGAAAPPVGRRARDSATGRAGLAKVAERPPLPEGEGGGEGHPATAQPEW